MSTSCLLLSAVLRSNWEARDANTSVCSVAILVQASILDVPINIYTYNCIIYQIPN